MVQLDNRVGHERVPLERTYEERRCRWRVIAKQAIGVVHIRNVEVKIAVEIEVYP